MATNKIYRTEWTKANGLKVRLDFLAAGGDAALYGSRSVETFDDASVVEINGCKTEFDGLYFGMPNAQSCSITLDAVLLPAVMKDAIYDQFVTIDGSQTNYTNLYYHFGKDQPNLFVVWTDRFSNGANWNVEFAGVQEITPDIEVEEQTGSQLIKFDLVGLHKVIADNVTFENAFASVWRSVQLTYPTYLIKQKYARVPPYNGAFMRSGSDNLDMWFLDCDIFYTIIQNGVINPSLNLYTMQGDLGTASTTLQIFPFDGVKIYNDTFNGNLTFTGDITSSFAKGSNINTGGALRFCLGVFDGTTTIESMVEQYQDVVKTLWDYFKAVSESLMQKVIFSFSYSSNKLQIRYDFVNIHEDYSLLNTYSYSNQVGASVVYNINANAIGKSKIHYTVDDVNLTEYEAYIRGKSTDGVETNAIINLLPVSFNDFYEQGADRYSAPIAHNAMQSNMDCTGLYYYDTTASNTCRPDGRGRYIDQSYLMERVCPLIDVVTDNSGTYSASSYADSFTLKFNGGNNKIETAEFYSLAQSNSEVGNNFIANKILDAFGGRNKQTLYELELDEDNYLINENVGKGFNVTPPDNWGISNVAYLIAIERDFASKNSKVKATFLSRGV